MLILLVNPVAIGGLCTDINTNGDDTDTDDADEDNYVRRTNHDYIVSFGIIPN